MAKKPQPAWHFKVSFGLVMIVMLLIGAYFYQSFLEVRAVRPVEVAIENIQERSGAKESDTGETEQSDE